MKAAITLFALFAFFVGAVPRAAAEDDEEATPPPRAPVGKAASAPSRNVGPKGAAPEPEEDDAADVAPAPDEKLFDPYAHDPYESEPSVEEGSATGDGSPAVSGPAAGGARGLEDPYATDSSDTDPYEGDGDN